MAKASVQEIFNAPVKKIFEVLTNYSGYPELLPECKMASVIDGTDPHKKLVEFEVSLVKTFRYQLWLNEEPFHKVSWKFQSGDIFKSNTGAWTLKELGDGKTQVNYEIEATFGLWVPGMIEKKVIEVNLPIMIKAYKNKSEA